MVTIKEFVKIRIKEDGKTVSILRSGDDLCKMENKWMNINWVIDLKNNWYRKTILDPETDEVVYHRSYPLDEHQGYGSAKKRP
jgi:hypothetical protein